MPSEPAGIFAPRPRGAHKHSVGTVTVVGGAPQYPHAPAIAALGARAGGAGLVRLAAPDETRFAAALLAPEATFTRLCRGCDLPTADVAVVGPGLAGDFAEETVCTVLSGAFGRVVADAGALAVLASARHRPAGEGPGGGLVLTPHEGEAAKLLGWERARVSSEREAAAREIAARYGATVVLKGPGTLVVSRDGSRIYRNETGNPLLACGGTGDLLAGALGARWAYLGDDPFTAAVSAVWLHGAAADALAASGMDPSVSNLAAELGSLRASRDGFEAMRR